MRAAITLTILATTALSTGCASITRGTTDTVTVKSVPEGAAISTDIGLSCPAAPCSFEVKRKTEFTAYADKQGYRRGSIRIGTKMAGEGGAALAGNILVGGIVGVGVDAATGATLDHFPNPATIVLQPLGAAPAPARIRKPGGVPML